MATRAGRRRFPLTVYILTAAPPEIPQALIDQLAKGGRPVAPVENRSDQELILVEKRATDLSGAAVTEPLCP